MVNDEGSLPPKVGALLRMAWQQLHVELYERMRAEGFDDLREVHRPLLRYPGIDGIRPSELAASLGLSRQAVNDLLREVEELGYVRLEPDPSDGRARIIRYTDRGRNLLASGSRISEEIGERWAGEIGRDSYDAMIDALRAVIRLDRAGRRCRASPEAAESKAVGDHEDARQAH